MPKAQTTMQVYTLSRWSNTTWVWRLPWNCMGPPTMDAVVGRGRGIYNKYVLWPIPCTYIHIPAFNIVNSIVHDKDQVCFHLPPHQVPKSVCLYTINNIFEWRILLSSLYCNILILVHYCIFIIANVNMKGSYIKLKCEVSITMIKTDWHHLPYSFMKTIPNSAALVGHLKGKDC